MMDRGTMNNVKGQKDKQRSTKLTHKTKYGVTRTSLRTGGELMCFMHNLNIPNTFFMVLMDSCCSIFSVLFYISLFVLFVLTIVLSVDLWLLFWPLYCLSTYDFCFDHCIVCRLMTSVLTIVLSVDLWLLFWPLYCLSFYIWLLNSLWYLTTFLTLPTLVGGPTPTPSHRVCNYINTTGVTSGAGTACPSGAPKFTPGF
jgi:hypothetical protein